MGPITPASTYRPKIWSRRMYCKYCPDTEHTYILTTVFPLLLPILTLTFSSLTLLQFHSHAFVRYSLIKQLILKDYIKQHKQVRIRKTCIILMIATGCREWVPFPSQSTIVWHHMLVIDSSHEGWNLYFPSMYIMTLLLMFLGPLSWP